MPLVTLTDALSMLVALWKIVFGPWFVVQHFVYFFSFAIIMLVKRELVA